jgi:hypothetical protein
MNKGSLRKRKLRRRHNQRMLRLAYMWRFYMAPMYIDGTDMEGEHKHRGKCRARISRRIKAYLRKVLRESNGH